MVKTKSVKVSPYGKLAQLLYQAVGSFRQSLSKRVLERNEGNISSWSLWPYTRISSLMESSVTRILTLKWNGK